MSSLGGHLNCVGGQQQKCDAVFSSKMMLKETYVTGSYFEVVVCFLSGNGTCLL